MPTIQQLQAEPWWGREIVTDELRWLGTELCRRTGRPADAFGSKGNTAHLSGGHRSQEWLKLSDYCENRSYTVQSGLTETQARHIGACDWTPGVWGTAANRALMVRLTGDLFAAARRGELAGVRQIFGTLNGTSAIGLNVVSNSLTYPDSSHLDHLHLTFDRAHMRDSGLMARIADIVTGEDMTPQQEAMLDDLAWRVDALWANTNLRGGRFVDDPALNKNMLKDAIEGVSVPELSDAQLAAIVAGVVAELKPSIDALRAGVEEDTRDAVADLGEGGAAKVRADEV